MRLVDKINHLRSSAAFLFEMGRAKNLSGEQIAETIRPISESMERAIQAASVGEKSFAIKSLEHHIEALGLDKKLIQQKIEDTQHHIENLKTSLINEMIERKTDTISEESFIITLIDGSISIR